MPSYFYDGIVATCIHFYIVFFSPRDGGWVFLIIFLGKIVLYPSMIWPVLTVPTCNLASIRPLLPASALSVKKYHLLYKPKLEPK